MSFIIEGTAENMLLIKMPPESINIENICFNEQKMYFLMAER